MRSGGGRSVDPDCGHGRHVGADPSSHPGIGVDRQAPPMTSTRSARWTRPAPAGLRDWSKPIPESSIENETQWALADEADPDDRGRTGVLDDVLERLDAAEVDAALDLRRVSPEIHRLDRDLARRVGSDRRGSTRPRRSGAAAPGSRRGSRFESRRSPNSRLPPQSAPSPPALRRVAALWARRPEWIRTLTSRCCALS